MNLGKIKPANRIMRDTLKNIRSIGIRANILPTNFPRMARIKLLTVDDEMQDYGGFGGAYEIRAGKFTTPFIVVNLAYNNSLLDVCSTLAHELLHIKQTICEGIMPHHGNSFRKDSAKFARIIGVNYWQLNGYDKPAEHTFVAIQKRKLIAFKKSRNV